MAGSWSELPGDLLKIIEGNLGMYDEKIRFRCVCTHFRQSVSDDLPNLRKQQPPWLLLPYRTGSMCGLYHPFEKKTFDIDLPEAGDKVFRGTGHGWVVTQQLNGSIDVLNPLTRVRVPLPPRYTLPDVVQYNPDNIGQEYHFENYRRNGGSPRPPCVVSAVQVRDSMMMEKVVLSSSPLSEDFIAVAVFAADRLAYCRVGDSEWRYLVEFDDTPCVWYKDVTFLGGKLYAVSRGGVLMVCDDFRSCLRLRKCDSLPVSPFRSMSSDDVLTNSPDSLVMARRTGTTRRINIEDGSSKFIRSTLGFEIYKLDVDPDTTTGWITMGCLDDDEILFMGLGSQILISSQDFTGNRIYFASDSFNNNCADIEGCFDNGVFDFEDGSFKPLDCECDPRVTWPLPIWFMPNPF